MKFLILILLYAFKSIYWLFNARPSKYYWELPIDKKIPLVPIFIIPYLFYFAFTAIAIIALWNTPLLYPYFLALFIAYCMTFVFWYFFPNGVKRPVIVKTGFFDRAVKHLYTKDNDTNGFPSAHVFVALLTSHYLVLAFPAYAGMSIFIGILISISTVFTKQHYIVDVPGGVIVYAMSAYLSHLIFLLHFHL